MRMPRLRFTVRRMVAVAVTGLLLAAWVYRLENASIDRSLMGIQLRAFLGGDAAQRRTALENLAHSGPDDRVLPALAAGLMDGDWQVRLAAARSLGAVGRGWVWSGAWGGDIDQAMRALIGAFDERASRGPDRSHAIPGGDLHPARPPWSPGRRAAGATFDAAERRAVALLLQRLSDSDPGSGLRRSVLSAGSDPPPASVPILSSGSYSVIPNARFVPLPPVPSHPVGPPSLSSTFLCCIASSRPEPRRARRDRLGHRRSAGPACGIDFGLARGPVARQLGVEQDHPHGPGKARPLRPPRGLPCPDEGRRP